MIAAFATAALLWSLPARGDQISDVRCMIASMELTTSKEDPNQTAAMISVMYFLGRIDGRDPAYDVKEAIAQQLAVMTQADHKTESARCRSEMLQTGQSVEDLGNQLRDHAKVELGKG